MHIIYHFKAFEKGFQMNVNASRNIASTFQSIMSSGNEIRNRVHFTYSGEIDTGRQPSEDILGDNLLFLSVCSHVLHYFFD